MLNKSNRALLEAYERGYRAVDGRVWSPFGRWLKTYVHNGYHTFGINFNSKVSNIYVHRLTAYQKYKSDLFRKDTVTRHLDGNPENNLKENVAIGS